MILNTIIEKPQIKLTQTVAWNFFYQLETKKQRVLQAGSSVPLLNKTGIRKMKRTCKRQKIFQAEKGNWYTLVMRLLEGFEAVRKRKTFWNTIHTDKIRRKLIYTSLYKVFRWYKSTRKSFLCSALKWLKYLQ